MKCFWVVTGRFDDPNEAGICRDRHEAYNLFKGNYVIFFSVTKVMLYNQ